MYNANPFSGIESPFFWPIGLTMSLGSEILETSEKNMLFFDEILKTEVAPAKPKWASPHRVMYELHTFTLRVFSKLNANQTPTLILPPYAGHLSTIADYDRNQSLIETLLGNGLSHLYCIDWHSATHAMKDYDIDTYLAELNVAISDLGPRVNLIGLCQGGWMAALYAARFPGRVASLVCAGAPLDTQTGNGGIRELANELPMSFYQNLVIAGNGLMKGQFMLEGFKSMHPEYHSRNKYLSLYANIDDPQYLKKTETFESWYENTIDLPGRWYLQVIDELFKQNKFAIGEFIALGQTACPQAISCPLYLLAGEHDDITPKEQVFNAANFVGTPKDLIVKDVAPGGHIGLFMGTQALSQNWRKIAAWILETNA
ncbi:MAG: alpha/beta fold hydrolase [Alphaproteobacteria bacterium]|nr:alpha/beta fold hydrolase [Alphaproteobacteria bacterium]